MPESGKVVYLSSHHEERWHNGEEYASREEAIGDGKRIAREYGADTYFTGIQTIHVPHIPFDCILENLVEDAYEEAGEVSLNWLKLVSKTDCLALEVGLNTALQDWMKATCHTPDFWIVTDVQKHILEDEDGSIVIHAPSEKDQ